MKALLNLLIPLFIIALIISCEEEGLEFDNIEPTIKVKFINADSVKSLDDSVKLINAEIKVIDARLDELDKLKDENPGTNYDDEIDSLAERKSSIKATKTIFQSRITKIESGKVLISKILAINGAGESTFTDSLKNYTLPLNTLTNSSEFLITIHNEDFRLTFLYERDTLIRESAIVIEASQLDIIEHTFDSVKFTCDTLKCADTNASAILYF